MDEIGYWTMVQQIADSVTAEGPCGDEDEIDETIAVTVAAALSDATVLAVMDFTASSEEADAAAENALINGETTPRQLAWRMARAAVEADVRDTIG